MRVRIKLGQCVWLLALVLGAAVTGSGVGAAASPAAQEDQASKHDYSTNKTYQQGMRDGQNDQKHKKDHPKNRHFKRDEDQRAYEAGYQQGRQGDRH